MGRTKAKTRSLDERFWRRVKKTRSCWLWTASVRRGGYGQIWDGSNIVSAHRLSWEMVNGKIPRGVHVLHKCDTPRCVRPSHLFIGDNDDNMHDMRDKGRRKGIRSSYGATHGMAKLTDLKVLTIRELCAAGIWSKRKIARRFGVTHPLISQIHKRNIWRHLT